MTTEYSKKKVIPIEERAKNGAKQVNERPKVKQVAVGKRKKKGVIERLVVGMIGPDGLPAIGHYVSDTILKPMFKDAMAKGLNSTIQMLIYGNDHGNRGGYGSYAPRREEPRYADSRREYYNGYSTRRPERNQDYVRPTSGRDAHTDSIVFDNREDAVNVLDTIRRQAEEYGACALADFYDAAGVDSEYTDNNFGWTIQQIEERAEIRMVGRGGYAIFMPALIDLAPDHDERKGGRVW